MGEYGSPCIPPSLHLEGNISPSKIPFKDLKFQLNLIGFMHLHYICILFHQDPSLLAYFSFKYNYTQNIGNGNSRILKYL